MADSLLLLENGFVTLDDDLSICARNDQEQILSEEEENNIGDNEDQEEESTEETVEEATGEQKEQQKSGIPQQSDTYTGQQTQTVTQAGASVEQIIQPLTSGLPGLNILRLTRYFIQLRHLLLRFLHNLI